MIKRLFQSKSPFKPSPGWLIISYFFLGIWTLVCLFPLYWLFITAFKEPIDVQAGPFYIPFVDFEPSLYGWEEVFGLLNPTRQYINTISIGLISSAVAILIGASASYALNRFTYRPKLGLIAFFIIGIIIVIVMVIAGVPWLLASVGMFAVFLLLAQTLGKRMTRALGNNDISFWIISQRILPPVAVIIPIYVMYQQLSLLNTHLGMVLAYTAANLPLAVWFLRDYFSGIPLELEESAFIDGATRYQVLYRIILPLAVPGLIATFLIVLVFAWNEYTMALFLTGAETQTMPLLVAGQNATRGPQWWNISVLVMMMIGPIIIMAIVLERYIARGILVGAVKG